jgi:hypothetical protein
LRTVLAEWTRWRSNLCHRAIVFGFVLAVLGLRAVAAVVLA